MTFDFINPLMLAGLAGLVLPILAHLLSKRKYDVVLWGAMQFLQLRRNTRRKLRLEELLLLLLRMGLVALLAVALARPWVAGGFLIDYVRKQHRDVVFVVDGSYSMGWQGPGQTPHAAAVQWARAFLDELQPGDSVTLIDARDEPRLVTDAPTTDLDRVREELDRLPPPAGSANLPEAIARAVQILTRTSNLVRDVIVLTDGQSVGWHADDERLWSRVDDLLQQPAVRPRIWVVNVLGPPPESQATPENFTVDRLQLSRELTVTGFPVRVSTKVRRSGGRSATTRRVYLEVDGQRLQEQTTTVQLPPDGAASVEFEYRFRSVGSHLVSVVVDGDPLPGDDRADAAVEVVEALPAVLVDGDPRPDPTQSETFFLRAALTARGNDSPWVRATVVPWDRFSSENLSQVQVAVLANVRRLTPAQLGAVRDFVRRGGGLILTLGDRVDESFYQRQLLSPTEGLLPVRLERTWNDTDVALPAVYASDASLQLPWLARFRKAVGGGFTEARFVRWWEVTPLQRVTDSDAATFSANAGAEGEGTGPSDAAFGSTSTATGSVGDDDAGSGSSRSSKPGSGLAAGSAGPGLAEPSANAEQPAVEIRLDNHHPLLLTGRYGRGWVALWTSSVDADWNTLPAKPDYVPFWHELIFRLTSGKVSRNVLPGLPLVAPLPKGHTVESLVFVGPGGLVLEAEPAGDELEPRVQLTNTQLPGVYRLVRRSAVASGSTSEAAVGPARLRRPPRPTDVLECFVVDFDRNESDLTRLTKAEVARLTQNGRLSFVSTQDELKKEVFAEDSRTEIWHLLLWLFLVLLTVEVFMTRRLVQRGQAAVDELLEPAAPARALRRPV